MDGSERSGRRGHRRQDRGFLRSVDPPLHQQPASADAPGDQRTDPTSNDHARARSGPLLEPGQRDD